jgi:hypothetical protein
MWSYPTQNYEQSLRSFHWFFFSGSVKYYKQHLFVCHGSDPSTWPSHIEKMSGFVSELIKQANNLKVLFSLLPNTLKFVFKWWGWWKLTTNELKCLFYLLTDTHSCESLRSSINMWFRFFWHSLFQHWSKPKFHFSKCEPFQFTTFDPVQKSTESDWSHSLFWHTLLKTDF